ncbi:MAG: ubiquinol-cytochrome c reductase iron-sulfur subunit [Dissulfurispiraceae bacterium]|jgi:menaquinol-cytochrome c reductase iron-sulfur subunit
MENNRFAAESVQEETSRRRFIKWLLGILLAVNGLIAGIPFLRSLVGPRAAVQSDQWLKVAAINSLPEGEPVDIRFMTEPEEAYIHTAVLRSVWVIKHSPENITVYSPICPHLGCYYQWSRQSGRFECPCHASLFALDGKVLGGPAPRPLDTLPTRIKDGNLFVKWERFKVGTPSKISIT